VTLYYPDVSAWQAGINLSGAHAVAVKVTEGPGYLSPAFTGQLAEAAHAGAFSLGYHFLHQGGGAAQADYCHQHAGDLPMMVDVEPVASLAGNVSPRSEASRDSMVFDVVAAASTPALADATAFIDRYRALGGILHWVYLPRWYHQELGSPSLEPLASRGMLLWSSDYTSYTDSSSGAGWEPYGGMTPDVWQYTETMSFGGAANVDFNAFRGTYAGKQDPASVAATLAEFKSLTLTGKMPAPPANVLPSPAHLVVVNAGPSSVKLQWTRPGGLPAAAGYQVAIQENGKDLPKYPRNQAQTGATEIEQYGSLPAGASLVAMVRALLPAGTAGPGASPWAEVRFSTPH
jgi:hypothetical protein